MKRSDTITSKSSRPSISKTPPKRDSLMNSMNRSTTPNKHVASRIDTGLKNPRTPDSQRPRENSPNTPPAKSGGLGEGKNKISIPDYVEPKKKQGMIIGRDRKLRDHNKSKIFREVVTNLFETRIDPTKLLFFLEGKCKEKQDMFSYNYAKDTNLMNLRFCIYLLAEELETIINNLDESHGNNYINSIDAKLVKRNEIINYLLREKMITMKLFTRLLSVFQGCFTDCNDLLNLVEIAPDFKEKGRFVSKLRSMSADLKIIDEFKSYAKAYISDKDFNNLVSLQKDMQNPMTREQFLKISDFQPVFDKIDKNTLLLEENRQLMAEMAIKEENYNKLLKKYDQLLKDFTDLTSQGSKQIVNPLGPEDYNMIFSKYKEVKEQERKEREERQLVEKKKTSTTPKKKKKSGSKSPDGKASTKKKAGVSPIKKASKEREEDETFAASRDQLTPEKEPKSQKKKVVISEPPVDEAKQGRRLSRENPFKRQERQKNADESSSVEGFRNDHINNFRGQPNVDFDVSKITRREDTSNEMASFEENRKKKTEPDRSATPKQRVSLLKNGDPSQDLRPSNTGDPGKRGSIKPPDQGTAEPSKPIPPPTPKASRSDTPSFANHSARDPAAAPNPETPAQKRGSLADPSQAAPKQNAPPPPSPKQPAPPSNIPPPPVLISRPNAPPIVVTSPPPAPESGKVPPPPPISMIIPPAANKPPPPPPKTATAGDSFFNKSGDM